MSWTCYINNQTKEALSLTAWSLSWGTWKTAPPSTIAAGSDCTSACDSSYGKVSGSVTYVGATGTVTITFDVPLAVGDPTYSATCTGAYAAQQMGGGASQAGGAMYSVTSTPVQRTVPVAPVNPSPQPPAGAPSSPSGAISFHFVRPGGPANTVVTGGTPGRLWTTNPNEVPTITTTPSIETVVTLLKTVWPELGDVGARTLTSQSAFETGFWANCYNYNFGNVKEPGGKRPFMCLRNNSECWTKDYADGQIAKYPGVVYYADATFISKHGCSCDGNRVSVVTQPPHPASWFHASSSYEDGAQRYLGHHKGYAAKFPAYLAALHAGDTDTVATLLRSPIGYFTGSLAAYKKGMKSAKQRIDTALGPIPGATPAAAPSAPGSSPPPSK